VFVPHDDTAVCYKSLKLPDQLNLIEIDGKVNVHEYRQVYFMDYAESMEENMRDFLIEYDTENANVKNVKFLDWRKRAREDVPKDAFELFDDVELQRLLEIFPMMEPFKKYSVDSKNKPQNDELPAWYNIIKFNE
jgi:hypothetical protein